MNLYRSKYFTKYFLSGLLVLVFLCTEAQDNNTQLEFKIDNDKLVLEDKYYTSGLFLTYRQKLNKNILFKSKDDNYSQLNIVLGNETYTPSNIRSVKTKDFDRPYAGWLFLNAELGGIRENSALFFGVDVGVTGKYSFAGKLQNWVHDTFDIYELPWTQEIESKVLVNLMCRYVYNVPIADKHAIQYEILPKLGSKDLLLSNAITYTFGDFSSFNTSSRNDFTALRTNKELYAFVTFGYKLVGHNTLIQGSLDYKDTTFTTNQSPHVLFHKFGGVFRCSKSVLKLVYNFNTRETPKSSSHAYGSVSFSRFF